MYSDSQFLRYLTKEHVMENWIDMFRKKITEAPQEPVMLFLFFETYQSNRSGEIESQYLQVKILSSNATVHAKSFWHSTGREWSP